MARESDLSPMMTTKSSVFEGEENEEKEIPLLVRVRQYIIKDNRDSLYEKRLRKIPHYELEDEQKLYSALVKGPAGKQVD